MNAIKRINKKVWIILIIGLVIQILFDPLSSLLAFSENIQARVGLPIAHSKWETQGTTDYSFRFEVLLPHRASDRMRVEVRSGEVYQIYPILLESDVLEGEPLPPTSWTRSNANDFLHDPFFDNYANFTIPQLLAEAERSLSSVSQISIDPRYGFVSRVRFGSPNGWGLLSPKISHCCWSFEIQNFQALDE